MKYKVKYSFLIVLLVFSVTIVFATADTNVVDFKDLLKITLHDGDGNPISSLNGALDIHDADVHTTIINRHFIDYDSATENPNTNITSGNVTILVDSTTGFTAGDEIVIRDYNGDAFEHHFEITSISVNTSITLNRPIDNNYNTSATIELIGMNMAVSGSLASPLIYEIIPPQGEVWHITRVLISITDQTAMDDSLFGGITELSNGVVLRENLNEGLRTITSWTTNANMKEDMYDVHYSLKAPAGYYGLGGRFSFDKSQAIVRLDGSLNESLQILIQDDLTDLDTFRIKAQGHTEDE